MAQIGMIQIGFAPGITGLAWLGLVINVIITAFVVLVGVAMVSVIRTKTAPFADKAILVFYFITFLSVNIYFYHMYCHTIPIKVPQYEIVITEDTNIKEITDSYTIDRIEDGKIIFH